MSATHDLIVIGAGPAGGHAALEAARHGLATVLLDENPQAGGQIWRAAPAGWRIASPEQSAGDAMRTALARSRVEVRTGHSVWSVAPGFVVHASAEDGDHVFRAPRLVVAAGVTERIMPFAGWTTPGVIGLAGATNLLKSQQMVPGRRCVVAGAGPLLYAVAAGILDGGGAVAAIVDLGSRGDWLGSLRALATDPALLVRGLGWRARLAAARVPIRYRHAVVRAMGETAGETAGDAALEACEIVPVAADGTPLDRPMQRIECDALAVGHGLVPSADLTRLLRARHVFAPDRGGWTPVLDHHGRTSVDGLYAAGDCTGVAGAKAAALAGTLAGLAVAHDAERLEPAQYQSTAARVAGSLARARSLGARMSELMAIRAGLLDAMSADTIVCRCEDVVRARLDEALEAGAGDMNELKAWTRCGMGPCQGRSCGEAAGELLARRVGSREAAGWWTARVPIRPQPIERLAPVCDYDAIWNSPAGKIAQAILPAENTRHVRD